MLITLLLLLTNVQIDHIGSYYIQGQYRDAKIDDIHIYFPTGRGFEIYDYSDATNPQLIGCAATDGLATAIDVEGDYIYIADIFNGLCIFNITDPANPVFIGHYDTEGFTEYVFVNDSLAYLADGDSGLVILDVSNPSNPNYLGSWTQSNYYSVTVFVADTIAYLGNITGEPLKIINVANPTNPFLIANCPQNPAGGVIASAYTVDTLAFLAGSWWIASELYHFLIVNVADPANPLFISGLEFDRPAIKVVVWGDYAYVNNQEDGIRIIDISNPESPVEIACFDEAADYGYGPAVYDSILVTPEYDEGFSIFDVSEPIQPIKLYHKPNFYWTSFAVDESLRYLYLLGVLRTNEILHTSIQFIDVNDIINPVVRSELNFLGSWSPGHSGPGLVTDYPYVAFGIKRSPPAPPYLIGVIDVSDIESPQLLRFETGTFAGPAAMVSPNIYAGHYNKLMIGDMFSDVFWIDSLDTPTRCYGAAINDSIAYAACDMNLVVLDLNSDSLIATYFHNHEEAGSYGGINIDYPYLFMSYDEYTAGHGFLIFDVSNPHVPLLLIDTLISEPITPYSWIGVAEGSYLKDTLFFLCRAYNGFDIWNVADPAVPIRILSHDTPHSCNDIYLLGDTIVVLDQTSLEVYCMTDIGIIEGYSSDIARRGSFIEVSPNPFRKKADIRYHIAGNIGDTGRSAHDAVLKIYDVSGKLVKSFALASAPIASGKAGGFNHSLPTSVTWDGKDNRGISLPQGVYFVTLETEEESYTTKVILLK